MKKKLLLNTYSSLLNQLIVVICGFILPRIILQAFGSEVNGLVNSITTFINFISFMELGVGAVVQSSLYKPLAERDNNKISMIIKSADIFFKRLSKIFLVYLFIVIIVYPIIITTGFDFFYVSSLIVILAIALFAQYYFGLVNQLLVIADQRAYVYYVINIFTILANLFISVTLIKIFHANIHIVKLTSSLVYLLRPIMLYAYVNKRYVVDKKIKIVGEPISQKWNGIAQHISSVVMTNTDSIILTFFSTLSSVSIYSVYYMIVNSIYNLIYSLTNGFQSALGNLIAKNKLKEAINLFNRFDWIINMITVILFTCTGILIVPFVALYTQGIKDTNYIQPLFSILITLSQSMFCIRTTYYCAIKAAGHYKETQLSAIIETILNIGISVLLVSSLGLAGVAIGTLVGIIYRTMYCVIYLSRFILKRPLRKFFKQILIVLCSLLVINIFKINVNSYFNWILYAIEVFIICSSISLIFNAIFYKKNLINLFKAKRNKLNDFC